MGRDRGQVRGVAAGYARGGCVGYTAADHVGRAGAHPRKRNKHYPSPSLLPLRTNRPIHRRPHRPLHHPLRPHLARCRRVISRLLPMGRWGDAARVVGGGSHGRAPRRGGPHGGVLGVGSNPSRSRILIQFRGRLPPGRIFPVLPRGGSNALRNHGCLREKRRGGVHRPIDRPHRVLPALLHPPFARRTSLLRLVPVLGARAHLLGRHGERVDRSDAAPVPRGRSGSRQGCGPRGERAFVIGDTRHRCPRQPL
mmetsp:Transcript_7836/g.19029  ORF Transcript_7836/g.19029 Transcript_7836/m.19029 type:complete len:253 (-) Transcript_7836:2465-3223(-)